MRFISTRGASPAVGLSDALRAGLAPDGGLYVPQAFPQLAVHDFDGADSLAAVAERLLAPYFADDALAGVLPAICRDALDLPVPVLALDERTQLLELFHGPTAAFKDFGARFLAACLARVRGADEPPITILVATSGDTGSAVAAAFAGPASASRSCIPRAGCRRGRRTSSAASAKTCTHSAWPAASMTASGW